MSNAFLVLLFLLPPLIVADNDWSVPCLDGWCSYDVSATENLMAGTIQINGPTSAISDITSAAGWEILNCTEDADAQDIRIVCAGDEASCSQLFDNGAEHTICGAVPFAHVTYCGEAEDQSMPEHVKSRIMRRDGTTPVVRALSFNARFDEIPASQHGDVSMVVFGSTIPGFNGNATIIPAGSRRRSRLVNKRGLFDSLLGDFNKTKSTDLPPINIDQSFNIFNTTLSCSANEQARLSVDVNAKLNAEVTVGAVLADVSADLEGGLSIGANIAGQFDTGKIPLFTVGLPGLSIPGILSLGPSFEIDAQALAAIDLDVSMDVELAYSFSDLQLFFPPSDDHASGAVVAPRDTPLKLSASPNVESNATLEAHLIPALKFGLSAFGADAEIFLDLDTFAALDLGLVAEATASVDSTGATNTSASVGGCVDINGGVSVNAGADASFFGLFDANTQVALFSKDFDFFKKCFEESTSNSSASSVTALVTSTAASLASSVPANATTSGGGWGLSKSASVHASESAILSTASFQPNIDAASLASSTFAVSSCSPESPITPVSSGSPAMASPSMPATSSAVGASNAPSTVTVNTATATPTTAASNTRTSSEPRETSSTMSMKSQKRGGWGLGQKSPRRMIKREFQCLSPDIANAASVVDQVISGSSLA